MKHFTDFPEIDGYPCKDPDCYWGYACGLHVPLRDFMDKCIEQHGHEHPYKSGIAMYYQKWPTFCGHESQPGHAFVKFRGFGGWDFCWPDDKGARPITYWPADSCSYSQWLEQIIKDIYRSEPHQDNLLLRAVHTRQMFGDGGWYLPAFRRLYPSAHPTPEARDA